MDGKSLLPIGRGQTRQGHDVLFWKYAHGRAIRQGPWKLVKRDKEPWQLYNIEADPVELNNLADHMPEKVRNLEQRWNEWADPYLAGRKAKKSKKKTK